MRSASHATAGIGRTTTSDASGVAKTSFADFFKRDFAETPASKPSTFGFAAFDDGDDGDDVRRRCRRYRGGNPPRATGDGSA